MSVPYGQPMGSALAYTMAGRKMNEEIKRNGEKGFLPTVASNLAGRVGSAAKGVGSAVSGAFGKMSEGFGFQHGNNAQGGRRRRATKRRVTKRRATKRRGARRH